MNLLDKDRDQLQLIVAFDYVLILVVDMSTRDYKELDGHLEKISSERSRDQILKKAAQQLPERDREDFL